MSKLLLFELIWIDLLTVSRHKAGGCGNTRVAELRTGIRYPIVVRLENVNYNGTSTNNFTLDELIEVKKE